MTDNWTLFTFSRAGSARVLGATQRWLGLGDHQPLLMERDPSNMYDMNAILLLTLLGQPCGYIAREDTRVIGRKLAEGHMLLCRCNGYVEGKKRPILVWEEGEEEGANKKEEATIFG